MKEYKFKVIGEYQNLNHGGIEVDVYSDKYENAMNVLRKHLEEEMNLNLDNYFISTENIKVVEGFVNILNK